MRGSVLFYGCLGWALTAGGGFLVGYAAVAAGGPVTVVVGAVFLVGGLSQLAHWYEILEADARTGQIIALGPAAAGIAPPAGPPCSACGKPTSYVVEFGRYYCASDRRFV